MITPTDVLREAAALLSDEPGTALNREQTIARDHYDRALAELASRLLGLDSANSEAIPVVLRAMHNTRVHADPLDDDPDL